MKPTKETNYYSATFTSNSETQLKKLRDLRIQEQNGWEPIGDTVINAVNDVRFAIYKEANGDPSARLILSDFIKSVSKWNNSLISPTPDSSPTKVLAKSSMLAFLDNGDLDLETGIGAGLDGIVGHSRIEAYQDKAELKNMNPLLPTENELGWAQYRAQQAEWNGVWDNHEFQKTNDLVNPTNADRSVHAIKPSVWSNFHAENMGMILPIDGNYKDDKLSTVNTWEAWTSTWQFFFDQNDYTGTLGHRANIITPTHSSMGWAISIDDIDNDMYQTSMFFEFGKMMPLGTVDDFNWLTWIYHENGNDLTNWLRNNLVQSTLPSDWLTKTKDERINLLRTSGTIKLINDNKSAWEMIWPADTLKINEYSGADTIYKNLSRIPLNIHPYIDLSQRTYAYNVLGSGLQVLYEDDSYDEWKNN